MGTYYMFGMSYCKTDECKELISGYSFALMVLKNKLFLKIKKKMRDCLTLGHVIFFNTTRLL